MARHRAFATVLLAAALAVTGCKRQPAEDQASIQKRLEEKGTIDLMDQVAKAPDYPPPADGHLTERQVKIYLDVRRREQKIREVAFESLHAKAEEKKAEKEQGGVFDAIKAIGDVADAATADLRAAQELGYNPKEYQWVRDRVLEAQMLQTTKALNQQVAQSQQSLIRMLEEQAKTAATTEQRAEIERQIQELKGGASDTPADSTPAKEFNAGLLARFKGDFDRLQAEDERIGQKLQGSEPRGQDGGR